MFSFRVDKEIEIQLLQQHHKEELYQLIDENREHLRKWLLWVDKRKSAEDLKSIISIWLTNYANNNGFDAGIRYFGKLAGMISLQNIDWSNKTAGMGYFLSEYAQGNGIITRCIQSITRYLFVEMKLNRIEIQCAAGNTKSMKVPERLGFTAEGIKKDGQWLYDHYEDIVTYSLLEKDWRKMMQKDSTLPSEGLTY